MICAALLARRGKGWYAVFMDDGHKVCYNPMQFARYEAMRARGVWLILREQMCGSERASDIKPDVR